MADIHIHREHRLGLAKARKTAWRWAEDGRGEVRHGVHGDRRRDQRRRRVPRAGVDGRLVVDADAFDLTARLGLLLGAFRGRIEAEIEENLDAAARGRERDGGRAEDAGEDATAKKK